MSLYTKIFGDPSIKMVKEMQPTVVKINSFESALAALSDEQLRGKTSEFKDRLQKGETLDGILPEAFAVVREASKRATGMRHFDVQMIGGMALHRGNIAEMRTGEGKTLVATLPAYLNALEGKGVHVVTVNDYLAKRDAVWMGRIYDYLGLSVGIIQNLRVSFVYDASVRIKNEELRIKNENGETVESEVESFKVENEFLRPSSRQEAYACDITYGTNNEYGFDYLRDNMVQDISEMVMRPGSAMHYAIIDEVDSILIDEARTPLIISAPADEATDQYYQFAKLVKQLQVNEDYNVDEKLRSATLTEAGIAKFEKWLGVENIYVEGGLRTVHHIEQALKAEMLFRRDKDYVVDGGGEVIIIDEFTGRKMPGRRYSEGLHQAIEAKENVSIQRESRTFATITFQNLFRMYAKLAGMTGTAATEAEELGKIYNIEVVVIPTNKQAIRIDHNDRIYKNEAGKFKAIVERIKESHAKNQPILVGTISVEKNEQLSAYLSAEGIPHEILNAKNHEREGEIIAQAGRPGAITLATNMAGRGVDIKLGGVPAIPEDIEKVVAAGGLFVLGTERHESRRIDNQLRGRSARQGDPGETQFFVSTEDDLMRIFVGDRLKKVMGSLPESTPIEMPLISKLLETAQKKVEGHNFDIRKHLLEYDDVLNRHRTAIYRKRRAILELKHGVETVLADAVEVEEGDENVSREKKYASLKEMILDMIENEIEFVVSNHTNVTDSQEWNVQEILETMKTIMPFTKEEETILLGYKNSGESKISEVETRDSIVRFLVEKSQKTFAHLEEHVAASAQGEERDTILRTVEKSVLLRAIDMLWVEHLETIDYVRKGIGLRGYGQRDPLVEYKRETYFLFNTLQANIQKEVVYTFFKVNIGITAAPTIMAEDKLTLSGATKELSEQGEFIEKKERDGDGNKIGRNDPCSCGSGKKYKKCHGQ